MKIRVGVIGGAGYTGGELIRLLLRHPFVEIIFIHSRSNAGKPVASIHQDLQGDTNLLFTDQLLADETEVLFLCLGHGESKRFLAENQLPKDTRIVDLTNDHRLQNNKTPSVYNGSPFVYGLPELDRNAVISARHIANPGCFATAIQLGLLPLARAGLLKEVYTTGITGSTGAGQTLSATSHFSWRENNIQAYKTLQHQHVPEILQGLYMLTPNSQIGLHFVPWRGDFTRGIFVSSQCKISLSLKEVQQLYYSYYQSHPFTMLTEEPVFLKQVINTNKCLIQLEQQDDQLVIHSVLDNLLKGAVGQAVQNMNLMTGLDERTGLQIKASYF